MQYKGEIKNYSKINYPNINYSTCKFLDMIIAEDNIVVTSYLSTCNECFDLLKIRAIFIAKISKDKM